MGKKLRTPEELVEKVRGDIRGGAVSFVYFNGEYFESRRTELRRRPSHTFVGEFTYYDTDADILDRCAEFVETYKERKKEQSARLFEAMGL